MVKANICAGRWFPALFFFLCVFGGCASGPLRDARIAFYDGRPEAAADILVTADSIPSRDKLVFYMEKGLILHDLGKYRESAETLLNASKLMDSQDIISIGRQSASLVTTERITEYKGEYSERLWVHTYLMMNFLLVGQYENALVEAKQSLKLFEEHADPLSDDYFTRALIALCYETLGEFNDAYIEYEKLAQRLPDPSIVAPDLFGLALKLGFHDDAQRFETEISRDRPALKPSDAELILFVGLGHAIPKAAGNIIVPPGIRFSFPRYDGASQETMRISVLDSGVPVTVPFITTDLDKINAASLDARAARVIAKETARVVAKETMTRAMERENELAGALLRLTFLIMEEPDTRCWQTLPGWLHLIRVPIPPGKHNVRAIVTGAGGRRIEEIVLPEFDAQAGGRYFYSMRVTG